MTNTLRNALALTIACLLAANAAAEPADPAPEKPSPPAPAAPPAPQKEPEAAANDILSKSAGPSTNCYRGFHTSFDYNITGAALTALGRQVVEPGGLCDQYRRYSAGMPVEIGVPVLPGVSVNLDKLCQMVQRPACPEPSGEETAAPQEKK